MAVTRRQVLRLGLGTGVVLALLVVLALVVAVPGPCACANPDTLVSGRISQVEAATQTFRLETAAGRSLTFRLSATSTLAFATVADAYQRGGQVVISYPRKVASPYPVDGLQVLDRTPPPGR